jgi:hypothetical protein
MNKPVFRTNIRYSPVEDEDEAPAPPSLTARLSERRAPLTPEQLLTVLKAQPRPIDEGKSEPEPDYEEVESPPYLSVYLARRRNAQ